MEKQRQVKILSIVALVLAISAMTLGFAAFSTTLSISSSATVTPSSEDFKVVLSRSDTSVINSDTLEQDCIPPQFSETGNTQMGYGCLGNDYFRDSDAQFTVPGQSVEFIMYAHNIGEYDAYLNSVTYDVLDNGEYKKCRAFTDATSSLVQAACEGIKMTVSVDGVTYEVGEIIAAHKLSKGSVKEIKLKIEYEAGAARVDGPIGIEFSNIKFNYSTVANNESVNLISFTIDGTTYQAEEGMTWGEWVDSQYSNGLFNIYNGTYVKSNSGYYISNSNGNERVVQGNLITDSGIYNYTSGGVTVH